jgi:hypothetical protein
MTRTDAQRIGAYIAKTTPTTVGLKVAAQLTGMKSGYAAVANDLQPVESQITAICTADNVPSAKWGQYLSFGRELWRRSKLGGAPALTTDAQIVFDKWVGYGAVDSVLIHIALDVFGITVV